VQGSRRVTAPPEDRDDRSIARAQDELQSQIQRLWEELEQLRKDRGSDSLGELARRARLPRATVHDWFKKRTMVPTWEELARLIQALGSQPERWRSRWLAARAALDDLRSLKARQSRPSRPAGPEPPASSRLGPAAGDKLGRSTAGGPTWRGSRLLWAVAVLLVAVAAVPLRALMAPAGTTVPSLVGLTPDQACRALRAAGLVCAPNDHEATREVNVVHGQDHPPSARVRKGTAVRYSYQTTPPLPLQRYQAPPPDSASFLSPTSSGPQGWDVKPPPGLAYAAGVDGVPGLIPIFRYRCSRGCGESQVYFLSPDPGPKPNFTAEGEAFRCFDPDNPPPGTRPLHRLINKRTHARTWAVPGTVDYGIATSSGFKKARPSQGPLCYIW
jgi:Cro/C1-type HTH DNA-binding domain/PASTA domain